MALNPGQVLGNRYRIVRLLGQGGFGAVYRAWDLQMQGACAIKENLDETTLRQTLFEREARLLFQLRHPSLPRVYDLFNIPGQGQYLVMDFVEGQDLRNTLEQKGGPLPEAQALAWIAKVIDALDYLHGRQPPIIHRDIKPPNILITPDDQVYLVDFGISKIYDPQQPTSTAARAVTAGYAPPEQYGTAPTDSTSDVYALGATLYHLLTNRKPPDSLDLVLKSFPPPPLAHTINPAISPRVGLAIRRAMELEKADRWQSVREFGDALSPGRDAFQFAPAARASSPKPTPPLSVAAATIPDSGSIPGPAAGQGSSPVNQMSPQAVTEVDRPVSQATDANWQRLPKTNSKPGGNRRSAYLWLGMAFFVGCILLSTAAWFGTNAYLQRAPGPVAVDTDVSDNPGISETTETASLEPTASVEPAAAKTTEPSVSETEAIQATSENVYQGANIVFSDAFDNNDQNWATGYADDRNWTGEYLIEDGVYRINALGKRGITQWIMSPYSLDGSPYILAASMHQDSGTRQSSLGLVFNLLPANDEDYSFYSFLINESGQTYNVVKVTAGEEVELTGWVDTDDIKPSGPNQLFVQVQEDKASFFINGVYVFELVEGGLTEGQTGFVINIYEKNVQSEYIFDDFELRVP